jgi:hypothetical protein
VIAPGGSASVTPNESDEDGPTEEFHVWVYRVDTADDGSRVAYMAGFERASRGELARNGGRVIVDEVYRE